MRKIVLFLLLFGSMCVYAVDVRCTYKPASYKPAHYDASYKPASYKPARYTVARSDVKWSNSILNRQISCTPDAYAVGNIAFNSSCAAPLYTSTGAPLPMSATGGSSAGTVSVAPNAPQTAAAVAGNIASMGANLNGGSKGKTTFSQETTINYHQKNYRPAIALDLYDYPYKGANGSSCSDGCGPDECGGEDGCWVYYDGSSAGWLAWLYDLFTTYQGGMSWREFVSWINGLGIRGAGWYHFEDRHGNGVCHCPLGSSLIPLLLMLLCYALFRLVRGEVREEQEMA